MDIMTGQPAGADHTSGEGMPDLRARGGGDAERILHAARRTRERHAAILELVAEGFREQPTANCVLAASRRLCANITALASDIARGRDF